MDEEQKSDIPFIQGKPDDTKVNRYPPNNWSAFPHSYQNGYETVTHHGMTLRDYFAAHAPITLADVMAYHGEYTPYEKALRTFVQMRADYADAMIAERKK